MSDLWDEARLQQLISDGIQESLNLDYKAAGALGKNNDKRDEVTKDVSAMANSAGGIIIYGLAESRDVNRRHMPERIDPIDNTQFSREWLEQVIMTIQPRIEGVRIFPVQLSSGVNHSAYVVEIPEGVTAHQARDKVYYRRFEFRSVPMEDYEIRLVMARRQYPDIQLSFEIEIEAHWEKPNVLDVITAYTDMRQPPESQFITSYNLIIHATNKGKIFGQFINAFITLPFDLVLDQLDEIEDVDALPHIFDLSRTTTVLRDNTVLDIVQPTIPSGGHGITRFVPILPGVSQVWKPLQLAQHYEMIEWGEHAISWQLHCDNAPPKEDTIRIKDIPVIDRRKTNEES